jgi:thiol-activated cytolysin
MKIRKSAIAISLFALAALACGPAELSLSEINSKEIDDNVRSMRIMDVPEITAGEDGRVALETIEATDENFPSAYVGHTRVTRYKMGVGGDEAMCFDPQGDVIYPGALLDGNSIASGSYRPLIGDRAPLNISISGVHLKGTVKTTIDSPSLSSVRQGIHDLLQQAVIGVTAANMTYELSSIKSMEEFNLKIGAGYKGFGVNIATSVDFSNSATHSVFLAKFFQKYFTLDVDQPVRPSAFFTGKNTWNDFRYQIKGDIAPVYISSITYGRTIFLLIESNESESATRFKLDAAFKGFGQTGNLSVNIESMQSVSGLKVTSYIYGGSAEEATSIITSNGASLNKVIANGADFSLQSPGLPMGYSLRYLKNNGIATLVKYGEYYVAED